MSMHREVGDDMTCGDRSQRRQCIVLTYAPKPRITPSDEDTGALELFPDKTSSKLVAFLRSEHSASYFL